jgi:hypothetical protein
MELDLSPETVSWLVNIELPTVLENFEVEGNSFDEVANLLAILRHKLADCQNRPITVHIG